MSSVAFLASLSVLVLCLQALLLLLIPTRRLMRIAAAILFIVASLSSYFAHTYGALMNKDMLRNAFQTDPAEIGGLVSLDLLLQLLLLGVLPAVLVWRVALPQSTWSRQFRHRIVAIAEAPLLLWASRGYVERSRLDLACVRSRSGEPIAHDNLYHIILGAAETRDRIYDPRMDTLFACRRGASPIDHE